MPEPKLNTKEKSAVSIRTLVSFAVVLAFGTLAGRARIGTIWPLGVAYVTAAFLNPRRLNPYMALAGVLCALCTLIESVPNIAFNFAITSITAAALMVITISRIALTRRLAICVAVCAYIIGTVCFKWDIVLASLSSATELLVCCVLIVVFDGAAHIITGEQRRTVLSDEEIICVVLVLMLAVLGVGSVGYMGVSLRDVFASCVTMLAAYLGGPAVGAGSGAVLGLAAVLGGSEPVLAVSLASAALAGGALRTFKKAGIIVSFLITSALLTLYIGGVSALPSALGSVCIASVVFAVLPKRFCDFLGRYVDANILREHEQTLHAMRFREATSGRLSEISGALSSAADVFRDAAERPREETNISYMMAGIPAAVCQGCVFYGVCWDKEFGYTFTLLQKLFKKYEKGGALCESDLGAAFVKRCVRPAKLIAETNNVFTRFSTNRRWQSKVLESRAVVGEELLGVSHVIDTLRDELSVELRFLPDAENKIRAKLDEAGVRAKEVCVEMRGGALSVTLRARACGGRGRCAGVIEPLLSRVCGREMAKCEGLCLAKESCLLRFEEARRFSLQTGVATTPKDGGKLSGDSHSSLALRDGRHMLLLCDGMGSGEAASRESAAAVSLMEDFYRAGFDDHVIIETINKLLMLSGKEEMFSTMDLCMVDLVSGSARFTKIGAPHSYIISGETLTEVAAGALPLGILDELKPALFEAKLGQGDVIVMFTDGVSDAEPRDEAFTAMIKAAAETGGAQQAAERILAETLALSGGKAQDDMTVLVATVKKRA